MTALSAKAGLPRTWWRPGTRVRAAGVLAAGVAIGFVALFAMLGDDAGDDPNFVVLAMAIGWGFVGTGVFASLRRTESRVGTLMTCVGFSWLAAVTINAMQDDVFSLGVFVANLWLGFLVHMFATFPTGRARGRLEHVTVALGYVVSTVVPAAPWLFATAPELCRYECPANVLMLSHRPSLAFALQAVQGIAIFAVVATAFGILVARWRRAGHALRNSIEPVLWLATPTFAFQAISDLAEGLGADPNRTVVLEIAGVVTLACVPFAFLAGILRSRLHQADVVGALSQRLRSGLEPGRLRAALAEATGDAALELVYWLPDRERFVDAEGRPVDLPRAGSGQASTVVDDGTQPVAALVYDASLPEAGDVARLAGDAALLWLENERLEAELRARITDLRRSRARIVHAADAERRRIERDLHDGVQLRLVTLLLATELKRRELTPDGVSPLLDGVEAGIAEALEELRVLAAGILPPVLSDEGLGAAVLELTRRTPVPVTVAAMPGERLPGPVEVAAYFVIAEALTNVVKHAAARRAEIRVACRDGAAVIEVSDDGRGGAGDGSGLNGLADRVGALDGRFTVRSPPGGGTMVQAEIPCAS